MKSVDFERLVVRTNLQNGDPDSYHVSGTIRGSRITATRYSERPRGNQRGDHPREVRATVDGTATVWPESVHNLSEVKYAVNRARRVNPSPRT